MHVEADSFIIGDKNLAGAMLNASFCLSVILQLLQFT